jgi:threonine synthase
MATPSHRLPSLVCPACGSTYPDRWRCVCGSPLEFAAPPRPDGPPPDGFDNRGLRAFDPFLPVDLRVTLGEGFTPVVDAPEWDATFVLEYCSPTGSFKDRGAATVVSRAVACGAERVIEDSSGNAGAAVAAYAARAGLDAEIYVPASVTDAKLRAVEAAGATPVRIEGTRADVARACRAAVEADEGWYASHAWHPAFHAGTATLAYELAARRDWAVPDAVVLPVGHGTLLLGLCRGFRALREVGWTDGVPRLFAAQAAGYAPIAADRGDAPGGRNDLADGIRVKDPVRRDAVHDALDATGGDAVAVSASATEAALADLRAGGFGVEPTAAVGPAGLRACRERDLLPPGADVVVPLTGRGM